MIAVYLVLYLLPLVFILSKGLPFLGEILLNPYYMKVLGFTVFQAFLSSVLSVVLGLPGAFIMARHEFRLKKTVNSIFRLPFVLPPVLAVLGFVAFYGNNGFLARLIGHSPDILYSFKAVLLAHTFYNFPVVISLVSDALVSLDSNLEKAAQSDGASGIKIFFSVTLPRILPAVLSAMSLVFLYCFSSFAIILILGGSPDISTAEVEIYRLARISLDTGKASALALVSLFCTCLVLMIHSVISRKTQQQETPVSYLKKPQHPVLCALYLLITCIFVLCPIASVVIRSFISVSSSEETLGFTAAAYGKINLEYILNTILIGSISAVLSVSLALGLCRKGRRNSVFALLPLATSSVILGLGYLVISSFFNLYNSKFIIILVHGIINTGFAYNSVESVFFSIPEEISEQSRSDGASGLQTMLRIKMPLCRPCLLSAFLFCFTLSCGELNATLLLGAGNVRTIPVAIYRLIGTYDWQGACAYGTVLTAVCFVVFRLGENFRKSLCF